MLRVKYKKIILCTSGNRSQGHSIEALPIQLLAKVLALLYRILTKLEVSLI